MPDEHLPGLPSPPFDIHDLLTPRSFNHPVGRIELRETHISWVILTGDWAYKIKKPVHLDFIDSSTLEQRRLLCEEEVRLNRRLAPEIYLDVAAIAAAGDDWIVGGTNTPVEYCVRMKQFPAQSELLALLLSKQATIEEIDALGELLGHFHLQAPVLAEPRGAHDRLSVLKSLTQLAAQMQPMAVCMQRLIGWTENAPQKLEEQLSLRERAGFVRECHGDLHAANIVRSDGRLIPFDCLEFDPGLRWIDTMNDIAFLAMDLASHHRRDLACVLLSRYLEVTGDYAGLRLLPYFAVYRAVVRANVDTLMMQQMPQRTEELDARRNDRLLAAAAWIEPSTPIMILMHGVSGSGKSWLSERLVAALPAIRVRSDVERKRQADVAVSMYSDACTGRTYAHLLECAYSSLSIGLSIVVDATFLSGEERSMFHAMALRMRVPWLIVSCEAAPATLRARLLERTAAGSDPSDASIAVATAQLASRQPLSAAEQQHVIAINTDAPDAIERIVAAVHSKQR